MPIIDYTAKAGLDGQEENMGGTKQYIFIAPVRDFATIQTVVSGPTTESAVSEITAAHTFATGKCFKKIYCTLDKGEVGFEPQGDRDGRSFAQKVKIFHPGASTDKIGFASLMKNDKFIVLVPLADGQVIQVGSADFYAEILPKFSSGTNSAGLRGFEFDISSVAPVNYVYSGAISETPAP